MRMSGAQAILEVLKREGVRHPDDAERAISLGVGGILVSNHSGRQSEAAPPSIVMCRASCESLASAPPCCSTAASGAGWMSPAQSR